MLSLPVLVVDGQPFYISFGAVLADLRKEGARMKHILTFLSQMALVLPVIVADTLVP